MTPYNCLQLFQRYKDDEAGNRARWEMILRSQNPASLPGAVDFLAALFNPDFVGRSRASKLGASVDQVPLDKLTAAQVQAFGAACPPARASRCWQAASVRKLYPSKPAVLLSPQDKLKFLDDVTKFCKAQNDVQVLWLQLRVVHAQLALQEGLEDGPQLESLVAHLQLHSRLEIDSQDANGSQAFKEAMHRKSNNMAAVSTWLRGSPSGSGHTPAYQDSSTQTGPLLPAVPQAVGPFQDRIMDAVLARHIAGGTLNTSRRAWKGLIDPDLEQQLVARALLLAGSPDAAALSASVPDIQALQDRVELAFSPCNPTQHDVAGPVAVHFTLKNVSSLLLRVFDINVWAYYTTKLRQVPLDMQLEGLGATYEQTLDYRAFPPMQRHHETITLDQLEGEGLYIVEAIGGGQRSRALIRRGTLTFLPRVSAAGIAITILDADQQVVKDGRVWVDVETFPVDPATGEAVVPFAESTQCGKPMVIGSSGDFAELVSFTHYQESYELEAGFHMEREALQGDSTTPLLLWASLAGPGGGPAPLALLQHPQLAVSYTDADGVCSTQKIPQLQLTGMHKQLRVELRLPERCKAVEAVLTGRVQLAIGSAERFQDLTVSHSWDMNCGGDTVVDLHLGVHPSGSYYVAALGRCGEAIAAGTPVTVQLRHSIVPSYPLDFKLQTDSEGRVRLGPLSGGVRSVTATLQQDSNTPGAVVQRQWDLPWTEPQAPDSLQIAAESTEQVLLPVHCGVRGSEGTLEGEGVQLVAFDGQGHEAVADLTQRSVQVVQGGRLALVNVPEGSHKLFLPRLDQVVELRAVKAAGVSSHPLGSLLKGDDYVTVASPTSPLAVSNFSVSAEEGLHLKLSGSKAELEGATVTLVFSRFVPTTEDGGLSTAAAAAAPQASQASAQAAVRAAQYSSGKRVSEEARYCLERRQLEKEGKIRVGNMIGKPSLLAHAWALGNTSAEEKDAREGEAIGGGAAEAACAYPEAARRCARACAPAMFKPQMMQQHSAPRTGFCLPPSVLTDIKCKGGELHMGVFQLREEGVDLTTNGDSYVNVVALSPAGNMANADCHVSGNVSPEPPMRDQGLHRALKPQGRYVQVSEATALQVGEVLRLTDAQSAKVNLCDSGTKLWALYGALLANTGEEVAHWKEFSFLPQWGSMAAAAKLDKLRRYACHELHLFVHQRDPDLFRSAVLPMLQCKLPDERQPVDLWLLGLHQELGALWGAPHRHSRLNALERVLVAAAAGPAHLRRCAGDMAAACRQAIKNRRIAAEERQRFSVALLAGDSGEDRDDLAAQLEMWRQEAASIPPPPPPPVPGQAFGTSAPMAPQAYGRAAAPLMAMASSFGGPPGGGGRGGVPAPKMMMMSARSGSARGGATSADVDDLDTDYEVLDEGGDDGADEGWADDTVSESDGGSEAAASNAADGGGAGPEADLALRQKAQQRKAFRRNITTQEWAEAGYWKQKPTSAMVGVDTRPGVRDRVPPSAFWADYAAYLAQQGESRQESDDSLGAGTPFLSKHLEDAGRTFTDAAAALAVIGLDLQSPAAHRPKAQGGGLAITAAAPAVAYHRQIQEVAEEQGSGTGASLTVVQRLFDAQDRYVEDEATGEQVERGVEGALQAGRQYGYHVILTSSSAAPQHLDLLAQVPQGALPLEGLPPTWRTRVVIAPYATHTVELPFYFPHPGTLDTFPATAARDGVLLAAAPVAPPLVVQREAPPATAAGFDWAYLARTASDAEIVQYLREGDLARAELARVAGRCRRRSFFLDATAALRDRRTWDDAIWKWALLHGECRTLSEYLPVSTLTSHLRPPVHDPLLHLDARGYTEYWPLVNRRAHALGDRAPIEDSGLRGAWAAFLTTAVRRPSLGPVQALKAVVLLLAQDRVDEAEKLFGRLKAQATTAAGLPAMQMDYLEAWLAISQPVGRANPGRAAALAARHPALADRHWADRWSELRDTLAELGQTLPTGEERQQTSGDDDADASLSIEAGPSAGQVTLTHHGQPGKRRKVSLAAYEIDVELLFSSSPFGNLATSGANPGAASRFAFVKPRASAEVELEGSIEATTVTLADILPQVGGGGGGGGCVVEARSGALPPAACTCSSTGIRLRIMPHRALLQASVPSSDGGNGRQPAVGAYCKVFVRRGGRISFHKDGYCDLRGMFDYSSVSSGLRPGEGGYRGGSVKYAVLVTSPQWGSFIQETS
mmetsp:Transcript_17791/g.53615  ORF Transcript_17791/g.53615 Transcript_17791/m.53615 type:complete len:2186 (+) Transcript_17791:298-6855(+)